MLLDKYSFKAFEMALLVVFALVVLDEVFLAVLVLFAVVLFVAYSLSQVYLTVNQIVGHHLAGRVFPGKEPICQMQETQEMWVQSLSQEDPLEEEMATHSNILAWKFPWTENPGYIVHGIIKSWTQLSY